MTLQHLTPVVLDTREETVIYRCQYEHFLTWHADGLDDTTDGWHHTGSVEDVVTLDGPMMTTAKP